MMYLLTKGVLQASSPNFTPGRGGASVSSIVIHKSEGNKAGGISWLTSPASQVSAHFFVGVDGSVTQLVDTDATAWHAGVVVDPTAEDFIQGTNPNSYTIGIECEGYAAHGFPPVQQAALVGLIVDICHSYDLVPSDYTIAFHRDLDKNKECPGQWVSKPNIIAESREALFQVQCGKLPLPQED